MDSRTFFFVEAQGLNLRFRLIDERDAPDGGFWFKIGNQLLCPFIQLYALDMECALSYFHLANIQNSIQNVLHPFRLFTDALDQRIIFVVGGKFIH